MCLNINQRLVSSKFIKYLFIKYYQELIKSTHIFYVKSERLN